MPGRRRNPNPHGRPDTDVRHGENRGGRGNDGKGGKGGKGGGKGGKRRGSKDPLYNRAKRDVMLSLRPELQDIRSTGKQANRQYKQASRQVGDIYGALGNQLQPLSGQYAQQNTAIAGDLQSQLASLTGMLGSNVEGVPQSELNAGVGMFGTLGAGGLENLASQRARNVGYNTSAQRQGAEEQAVTKRNYLTDLMNFRGDLSDRRQDVLQTASQQILQRLADLRDQQFQQKLANQTFQLNAKTANQDQLASQAASDLAAAQAANIRRRWG